MAKKKSAKPDEPAKRARLSPVPGGHAIKAIDAGPRSRISQTTRVIAKEQIHQLEDELVKTKHELRNLASQLDNARDEYQATSEELLSIAEELRSTNQDFQASGEEAHFLNHELAVINQQLKSKVDELETNQEDLKNLIAATNVATLYLDCALRVRWFTPAITRLIRLNTTDRGRPVSDIAHDFLAFDLIEACQSVLDTSTPSACEVQAEKNRTYLRRISPYSLSDQSVGGVVITFVDITQRKLSENALAEVKNILASDLDDMQQLHEIGTRLVTSETFHNFLQAILSEVVRITRADSGMIQLLDKRSDELRIVAETGTEVSFASQFRKHNANSIRVLGDSFRQGQRLLEADVANSRFLDSSLAGIYDKMGIRAMQSTPLKSRTGEILGIVSTHYRSLGRTEEIDFRRLDLLARQASELIERAQFDAALKDSERRLQLALDAASLGNWEANLMTGALQASARHRRVLGMPDNAVIATREDWIEHILIEDRLAFSQSQQTALRSKSSTFQSEYRVRTLQGDIRDISSHTSIVRDEKGLAVRLVGVIADVTEKRESERQLRLLTASLEKQVAERVYLFEILQDIAIAANESRAVKDVMQSALRRITCFDGWIMGHFHLLSQQSQNELNSANIWHIREELVSFKELRVQLEKLQAAVSKTLVAIGTEGVDKLTATRQPVFLTDFRQLNKAVRACAVALNLKAIVAFPIFADQEVVAVVEFFSSEVFQKDQPFLDMMYNVGIQLGHVIERKRLEQAIADAAHEQQRHFGRELHDGVAQQLTGLTMMAHTLWENLEEAGSPYTSNSEILVKHLKNANEQVRRLSRGLMPVEVDGEGLIQALRELVRSTGQLQGIDCQFSADESVWLPDDGQRSHLYRIAQEALHNASKHGQAQSIVVRLSDQADNIVLTITDDAGGFEPSLRLAQGAGLRIMRYRAELIGGRLDIDSKPGAKTTITCHIPKNLPS